MLTTREWQLDTALPIRRLGRDTNGRTVVDRLSSRALVRQRKEDNDFLEE